MATLRDRLLYWLCDPTLSEADFAELEAILRGSSMLKLIERAKRLRELQQQPSKRAIFVTRKESQAGDAVATVAKEVDRLLRREVGLLSKPASRKLYRELALPIPQMLAPTLREEVERLLRTVTASQVLAAAHRIRKENSESSGSEWPLEA